LACSGLHTTPTVSSHPLDLGLSSAPGSFAPRDGSPESLNSGKQLSFHSQGAITALAMKPLSSRLPGFTISLLFESLSRTHWTGSGQPVTPVRILPKKFSLDRTAPPSILPLGAVPLRHGQFPAPRTPTHGYRLVNISGFRFNLSNRSFSSQLLVDHRPVLLSSARTLRRAQVCTLPLSETPRPRLVT